MLSRVFRGCTLRHMTIKAMTTGELDAVFGCMEGVAHAGLAVSGGADSMALMHLAHRWSQKRAGVAPRLTILSVDHGLRPESAQEAEWVVRQAGQLGLPARVLRWQPGNRRSRIQEAARQARYDLMAGFAHANAIDALVTAHHLDDQAETVLMRLARGSGLDGLAGIRARGEWAGLVLLRPFIDVPKARLVESLRQQGIDWLEDPSNEDTQFERVRVRQAMKKLEKLGIDAESLARSARRLRRAGEALDHAAGEFLRAYARATETGYCRIDAEAFAKAPGETALRALSRAIQGVGGRVSPPRLSKLEALYEALTADGQGTGTLGGCALRRNKGDILVLREGGRRGPAPVELEPGQSGLWDGRYRISLDATGVGPVQVRPLGREGYGAIRDDVTCEKALPGLAAAGLVSFWRGDSLLAVPPLGYVSETAQGAECRAELVNHALFGMGR